MYTNIYIFPPCMSTASPLPLQDLCRREIRLAVGKEHLEDIYQLPLPTMVKRYILYQWGHLCQPQRWTYSCIQHHAADLISSTHCRWILLPIIRVGATYSMFLKIILPSLRTSFVNQAINDDSTNVPDYFLLQDERTRMTHCMQNSWGKLTNRGLAHYFRNILSRALRWRGSDVGQRLP